MLLRIRKTLTLRRIFWLALAAAIVLALLPAEAPLPSTGWDKSNHLLSYLVLAFIGLRAYPARRAIVLAGVLLHGGLIELLQSLTPYRMAEWADFWADGMGVLAGLVLESLLAWHVLRRARGAGLSRQG